MAIADRFGLVAWSIHRLLPVLCESLIWIGEFAKAELMIERLHEQSKAYGHPLGLALAKAARAILRRFRDQAMDAWVDVLAAADGLEEIRMMLPAMRLRVNAAQLLIDAGRAVGVGGSATEAGD